MSVDLPLDVEIVMSQNNCRSLEALDLCEGINVRDVSNTLGLMCPRLRFLQGAQLYFELESSPPLPLGSYTFPMLQIGFEEPRKVQTHSFERYYAQFSKIVTATTSCTRELELIWAIDLIPTLLLHVSPLSNLHSLTLNSISDHYWRFASPPSEFPVLVNLRSFSLTLPDVNDFKDFQAVIYMITANNPFPNLDEFYFRALVFFEVPINQLDTLLTQIRNVESLALHIFVSILGSPGEEDNRGRELIHMERLLKLSLDHFNILKFLDTPNLRSLKIHRTLIPEEITLSLRLSFGQSLCSLTVPHTSFDEVCLPLSSREIAQSFPVLTSIHLVGSGVCRPLIYLVSIVSVSFHWMPRLTGLRGSIHHFLYNLISYPDNLPHLRHLSFGVFPMGAFIPRHTFSLFQQSPSD
ncbi:hypothetical protein M408DRAFT_30904 [Serendipita vermifera MAFF 305830]|uniref:F-box domain-containing protein n=1 Tax=Serendipita vermifera MAFF 305830 TaxID=933852 RepID=A0A0C2VZU5_SERVB|nr:hypothetical protein M408DRAFT_30904 [Serendipita vermifera MAFF 305830]